MPDTFAPRSCQTQQTHYERHTVNFNSTGIGAGVQLGTIGLNAFITRVHVHILTAFNAGTTNVLTLGTTLANANELVASGDVTPGTVGYTDVARGRGMALTQTPTGPQTVNGQSFDTTEGGVGLFVKFTSTGTAPTAGSAVIVVEYVPQLVGM